MEIYLVQIRFQNVHPSQTELIFYHSVLEEVIEETLDCLKKSYALHNLDMICITKSKELQSHTKGILDFSHVMSLKRNGNILEDSRIESIKQKIDDLQNTLMNIEDNTFNLDIYDKYDE